MFLLRPGELYIIKLYKHSSQLARLHSGSPILGMGKPCSTVHIPKFAVADSDCWPRIIIPSQPVCASAAPTFDIWIKIPGPSQPPPRTPKALSAEPPSMAMSNSTTTTSRCAHSTWISTVPRQQPFFSLVDRCHDSPKLIGGHLMSLGGLSMLMTSNSYARHVSCLHKTLQCRVVRFMTLRLNGTSSFENSMRTPYTERHSQHSSLIDGSIAGMAQDLYIRCVQFSTNDK